MPLVRHVSSSRSMVAFDSRLGPLEGTGGSSTGGELSMKSHLQ